MKHVIMILLVEILLLSGCSAATGIEISKAWARPAMEDENGVIYFLLQNHSASADELTGISSDISEAVEMHETSIDGDIMRMRQVISVPIKGKTSVEFAPGGYHVMLVNLKKDLKIGDEIQVTLHFRDHDDIAINVPVLEQGGDSMSGH